MGDLLKRDLPALSTCDQLWITHRATLPRERTGPGNVPSTVSPADRSCRMHPRCDTSPPGPTPHSIERVLPCSLCAAPLGARLVKTAKNHSERCCGIPASSARTSVSR